MRDPHNLRAQLRKIEADGRVRRLRAERDEPIVVTLRSVGPAPLALTRRAFLLWIRDTLPKRIADEPRDLVAYAALVGVDRGVRDPRYVPPPPHAGAGPGVGPQPCILEASIAAALAVDDLLARGDEAGAASLIRRWVREERQLEAQEYLRDVGGHAPGCRCH